MCAVRLCACGYSSAICVPFVCVHVDIRVLVIWVFMNVRTCLCMFRHDEFACECV